MTMLCLSKHSWKQPCFLPKIPSPRLSSVLFYYNIFIYFIQITLNVLYGLGGGGGGGQGEGNSLIWTQQVCAGKHGTLPLSFMKAHFF